ncbi:MAG: hypothetical protein H0T73_21105 [Ardenticatenales bacterium]|nr:hypothetical protein [Ardenticatenales bacterium]
MTLVNIRLWGHPDEVAEATRRLDEALQLLHESEPYTGRKSSGEVWRRLTLELPVELPAAYDPETMMWSVFAGMFYLEHIYLRTRENLVEDLVAEPILQAIFRQMGSTPKGRAILRKARAEWAAHDSTPPWEAVLGAIDRTAEESEEPDPATEVPERKSALPDVLSYSTEELATNFLAQAILRDLARVPEGRLVLRMQRVAWDAHGTPPPWETVLGPLDQEPHSAELSGQER